MKIIMMYSARCRRPWGTSRTDQDDDQDLAQLRRRRESHRGQREELGEQDYSCPSSLEREEGGGQDYSCHNSSTPRPPPPPPPPALPNPPPPPSTYPGPERREGGSQPADPSGEEVRGETGGGGVTSQGERGEEGEQHQHRRGVSC